MEEEEEEEVICMLMEGGCVESESGWTCKIQSLSDGLAMVIFLGSSLRTGPPFHSKGSAEPSGCAMHMPVQVSIRGAPQPGMTSIMLSCRMSSSRNDGLKVTSKDTSVPGASLPAMGVMLKCGPKEDSIHW